MNSPYLISVCLPVYNFDVTELVDDLLNQANTYHLAIEILVFDDHSISYYKKRNQTLSINKDVSYLEFEHNLGRSKIRNRLADFAAGIWLLFLDCDMVPMSPNFLQIYAESIKDGAHVVCGGVSYGPKPFKDELLLRWRYGIKRESRPPHRRQFSPYAAFMSGNFMIAREAFHQIRFNEEISGYGHEDTFFGLELKRSKIPILHIDNPCIHLGLEPCYEYLAKSEQGIVNLVRLLRIAPDKRKDLEQNIRLLRFYRLFRFFGLSYPLRWVFKIFNPIIRRMLCNAKVPLMLFDLYKLGLIAKTYKNPNLSSKRIIKVK